jgi:hypothetical protein
MDAGDTDRMVGAAEVEGAGRGGVSRCIGNFFLVRMLGRNLLADHGLRYAGGVFRYASYASMQGCGGSAGLRAVDLGL